MATKRPEEPRKYVSQTDVPKHTLEDALRIPRIIFEKFDGAAARPLQIAKELELAPNSAGFRMLAGAALAYGLTDGGPTVEKIGLTSLGRRIVGPTEEGDDIAAKREAVLIPRVSREFLTKYDGKPVPKDNIGINVLAELGVPRDAARACLDLIIDNARAVDVITVIKGVTYVDLAGAAPTPAVEVPDASAVLPPEAKAENKATTQEDIPSSKPAFKPPPERNSAASPSEESIGPLRRALTVDAYTLEDRLGHGFSAEVWSARVNRAVEGVEIKQGQMVAIKFYHAHAMALPDQVIRIEREFRIAQKLRHENLLRIYEFVLASSRPHHNFLVMDLAPGSALKSQIPSLGMPVQKAMVIARQLTSAVAELHAAGALHRDIKPANVAVSEGAGGIRAVLLDLGIVSVLHEKGLTNASRFLGSKHWAPYEQLVGEPIDARSDLYSLGAVCFSMLTGETPYDGKPTEAAVAIDMMRRPLRLPDNIAGLSANVRDMINACLATDPSQRPRSAKDCLSVFLP